MANINELKFVRVIDPNVFQVIPRKLLEQIDGIDDEGINRLYECGSSVLTMIVPSGKGLLRIPNPLCWIAVLTDEDHKIKGFLWAEIDVIERNIFVRAYSIDRQYQTSDGEAGNKLTKYLFDLPIDPKYKQKIVMATTRAKATEKYGWKKTKSVLMEFISPILVKIADNK